MVVPSTVHEAATTLPTAVLQLRQCVDAVQAAEAALQKAGLDCLFQAREALEEGSDPLAVAGELARLPRSNLPAQGLGGARQSMPDLARLVRACPSKKKALELLYEHRIQRGDRRSANAIAEVLVKELEQQHSITFHRAAACRIIKTLHGPRVERTADQD